MAGKVLTKEDFEQGGDPTKDTSTEKASATTDTAGSNGQIDSDEVIDAGKKFDQDMKPIDEEPTGDESTTEKEEVVPEHKEPLPKPSEDFKPKHKTWEETERARIELERAFTERSMKTADLERRLAALERPPEKQRTVDDLIADITDAANAEIENIKIEYLDGKPTPESLKKRDREAAIIWGKATHRISRLSIDETTRAQDAHRSTVQKLYDYASREGLTSNEDLSDLGFYFDHRTDPNASVDDRVREATTKLKSRISQLRQGFVKSQENDKKEKENLRVLGRGSSRTGKEKEKEDKSPTTMSQQLLQTNESRRLRREDL